MTVLSKICSKHYIRAVHSLHEMKDCEVSAVVDRSFYVVAFVIVEICMLLSWLLHFTNLELLAIYTYHIGCNCGDLYAGSM